MYWNIQDVISHNKFLNFIVGNRGAGKSYSSKKYCIDDFLKNGSQFVWVRRFDSELDDFQHTFFSDILHNYPDSIKFHYKHYKFYINDVVAGFSIPLSISSKKKSSSYHKVNKIIFDEFIIDKGHSYYLKKEVEVFLDLIETVFRMRENIKGVFCLANSITFINPYFLYFNLDYPKAKNNIYKKDDILLQLYTNDEFIEKKKNTRFGKLIANTEYANYSIENKFLRDNNNFIGKPEGKLRYLFTIKNDTMLGVWITQSQDKIYVSKNYDKSSKLIYTTKFENHQENTMLIKSLNESHLFKHFIKYLKNGFVLFENLKIKGEILAIVSRIL